MHFLSLSLTLSLSLSLPLSLFLSLSLSIYLYIYLSIPVFFLLFSLSQHSHTHTQLSFISRSFSLLHIRTHTHTHIHAHTQTLFVLNCGKNILSWWRFTTLSTEIHSHTTARDFFLQIMVSLKLSENPQKFAKVIKLRQKRNNWGNEWWLSERKTNK